VLGAEVDRAETKAMIASSGKRWDGAAVFPTKARDSGLVDKETARRRLAELEAKIKEDRPFLRRSRTPHRDRTPPRRMKPLLRILDTGLRSARWNVAMTAALVEMHAEGGRPDTVRFHRYAPCVLLGRCQDLDPAADVAYCRQAGIEIARRVTVGGAVYMSPRMLAWDVIAERKVFGGDLGLAAQIICESVAAGLCRLGCTARFRPANDIEIDGLKVSGSSGYAQGRSIALQGTILIEDDAGEMSHALRIPEARLRGTVTCLADSLGEAPTLEQVRDSIVEGLASVLGRSPVYHVPDKDDLAAAEVAQREIAQATGAAS
jgi:lipoate-protein ligase A